VKGHQILAYRASRWSLCTPFIVAASGALLLSASVQANGPVFMGDDVFSTPCGGGTYDYDPIPPGFFTSVGGASSLVYDAGIELGGVPLAMIPLPAADVDTIVRRLADTSPTFTCGSPAEVVPIQIEALHLASCTPITVNYNDNTSEQWDVSVCLDPTQTLGSMTLNHECAEGGSYSSSLPVQVILTFTRVGGGGGSPLTMSPSTLFFDSTGWWTHQDGLFDIVTLAAGDQFDAGCDGVVDAIDPSSIGTSNFYPGQFLQGCAACSLGTTAGPGLGCCDPVDPFCDDLNCFECVTSLDPSCAVSWTPPCASLATGPCVDVCPCGPPPPNRIKPKITAEAAQLAAHGIVPANPGKFSGGGTGGVPAVACCKPFTNPPTRCIDVDATECVTLWGGTPVAGENCATVQCANDPTYENWVIAGDFNISCPKCQCDFDFDGLCTAIDLLFVNDCINNGGGVNCDQADLNCDGAFTAADAAAIQCLFVGNAPDVCCPNARPKITRVRWYGSYFDPAFEPPTNTRDVDAWLIGLHSDVPAQACPPPPPGTEPVDLCGTIDICPNDAAFWVFTPKGSSFQYNVDDPSSLLSGASPGDMVRICGFFDLNAGTLACTTGIDLISVSAVMPCDSKVSKPNRLLAQWGIDPALVTVDDTGKVGCDGHRIFRYTADLPEGCLLHNFSTAGEVDASKRICPLNNRTYWLSIQAAEGHRLTLNADGSCNEVPTGDPPVTQDFWGWHTTPPGYQRLDDAYSGSLHMAVDPNDPTGCTRSWVYDWMGDLHCSDPRFTDCCDDPTKSIDMAFCLIQTDGHCGSTNITCTTDADCVAPDTCIQSEFVRWCQPVNPGPPPPPLPPIPPLPPANPDELKETVATATLTLNGQPPEVVTLTGPTVVKRGIEHEDIGAPRELIDTEIIAMDLVGSSPSLGAVRLGLNPNNPSTGLSARNHGDFQVDSFFDVWVEITVNTQVLITPVPVRVTALHFEIPPGRVSFDGPADGIPVPLIDSAGVQVGTLDQISHFIPYKGGMNIHSDVDWPASPINDCCEPNAAATACEPVICPDPTQKCVPTEQDCQCAFGCTSTGDPCLFDSDCPIAGDTCDAMGCVCTVFDCECRSPDPACQAVEVFGVYPPIQCVNDCPSPDLVCVRTGIDTDGDGIDDKWRCDCDPINDPTGVCCEPNGLCFVTTAAQCPVPPNAGFHPGATCTGQVSCCLPDGTCANLEPVCCQDLGGKTIFGALCSGTTESCCFADGSCQDLDPVCCQNQGGTPGGVGSACANADVNMNGIDDACEQMCDVDPVGPGCIGSCPNPAVTDCVPRCVNINPVTGVVDATVCECTDPNNCHVVGTVFGGAPAPVVVAGPAGNPCVVADDGSGTVTLPPEGCEYLSPQDVHMIIDGLPVTTPPTTIELGLAHRGFFCSVCEGGANSGLPCDTDADCPGGMCRTAPNSACSFNVQINCDQPGGALGGEQECSQSEVSMQMTGTGMLAGFNRTIVMPVQFETQTAPRAPGDAVQSFDTDMFNMQGAIFGDPDFDLLRITAGTGVGLPSPGHTTLTRLGPPGGDFQVDSFFDIDYQIEFVGAPGSVLMGLSGTTTGTIRMSTGAGDVQCAGSCPAGQTCRETRTLNPDGTFDLCCECVDAVCEPTLDAQACEDIICPIAGEICVPQQIKCTAAGCRVTVCDCQPPNDCHVDLPLQGTTDPVCSGGCPFANQRCVHFQKDLDGDGLPQEHFCKCVKKLPPIVIDTAVKHNRYLTMSLGGPLAERVPENREGKSSSGSVAGKPSIRQRGGTSAAIRVKVDSAPQFPGAVGNIYWVGVPSDVCEDALSSSSPPGCAQGSFTTAALQCDPLLMDWTSIPSLSVRGPDIVPGPSTYIVQWVDSSCADLSNEDCFSDPVTVSTRQWGDIVAPFGCCSQPNFGDISKVVDKFQDKVGAPSKSETDLGGHVVDLKVNFADINLDVQAFQGAAYPFTGPCTCPSSSTCPTLDACGRCTTP